MYVVYFFFFKQKTAYEMRISDWSSDVCSSDLGGAGFIPGRGGSVDVLQTALANANPAYRGLSDAKNKVYALVPDYQLSATPLAIDGHAQPGVGQQIVIPDGMTDLPAGTYTLLPAEYALMKGGYRVEIGKAAGPGASGIARMER